MCTNPRRNKGYEGMKESSVTEYRIWERELSSVVREDVSKEGTFKLTLKDTRSQPGRLEVKHPGFRKSYM